MSNKTEKPTALQLRRLRDHGDVPRSTELTRTVGFLVAIAAIPAYVGYALAYQRDYLVTLLKAPPDYRVTPLGDLTVVLLRPLIFPSGLFFAIVVTAILVVGVGQTGGLIPSTPRASLSRRMLGKAPFQPISGNSLYTITSRFSLMVAAWFITCWVLLHDAATLVAAQGNVDRLIAGLILSSRRIVWGFGACLVVFAFVHVLLTWTAFRKRSKMSLSQLKRDQREQLGAPEILTARKQHLIDLTHTDPERLLRYTNLLVDDGASTTTLLAYDPAVDIAPRLLKTVRGIDRERLLAVASSLTVPVVKSEWLAARLASASPLAPLPQELHSALAEAYAAPVKTN